MISSSYAALVEPPLTCARVIAQDKNSYLLSTNESEIRAQIRGALRFEAADPSTLPVVGDFVAATISEGTSMIEEVLPRKNLFARRAVWGSHCLQPIAANLDTLFITLAMNRDFNLRRIERYAIAAAAYSVPFAVLLTKSDLVDDAQPFIESAKALLNNTPVISVSATEGDGMAELDPFRGPGKTIAFVGSSGVGKSTVINVLSNLSSQLEVQEARENDDRGRHTTTRRFLLELADGTAIIDTPGMREFSLADADEGISIAFADVVGLAENCRFKDCQHRTEPGCTVRESLDEARLSSWRKLEREAAFEARKNDPRLRAEHQARWKAIHKANRKREH